MLESRNSKFEAGWLFKTCLNLKKYGSLSPEYFYFGNVTLVGRRQNHGLVEEIQMIRKTGFQICITKKVHFDEVTR